MSVRERQSYILWPIIPESSCVEIYLTMISSFSVPSRVSFFFVLLYLGIVTLEAKDIGKSTGVKQNIKRKVSDAENRYLMRDDETFWTRMVEEEISSIITAPPFAAPSVSPTDSPTPASLCDANVSIYSDLL